MSQRVAWSLKAVVVSVSLIVVTGLWLWSTLPSTDDARSALSEVLPEHAQIVNERIYRCNTDDGREDVDMVRGKDEIYVIVPGSVQRHECLSQARADTTIAVWECAALVRYT